MGRREEKKKKYKRPPRNIYKTNIRCTLKNFHRKIWGTRSTVQVSNVLAWSKIPHTLAANGKSWCHLVRVGYGIVCTTHRRCVRTRDRQLRLIICAMTLVTKRIVTWGLPHWPVWSSWCIWNITLTTKQISAKKNASGKSYRSKKPRCLFFFLFFLKFFFVESGASDVIKKKCVQLWWALRCSLWPLGSSSNAAFARGKKTSPRGKIAHSNDWKSLKFRSRHTKRRKKKKKKGQNRRQRVKHFYSEFSPHLKYVLGEHICRLMGNGVSVWGHWASFSEHHRRKGLVWRILS